MDDLNAPAIKRRGGARSGAGQPAYEPTHTDRVRVQNLAAFGATHAEIAKYVGAYGVSTKTLRKHFSEELAVSSLRVQALAMSKLVAAINAGEAWAICFFLKTRSGFRESSGKDRELTRADTDRRH